MVRNSKPALIARGLTTRPSSFTTETPMEHSITLVPETILITGANAGLGKETARQLALKKETKKVILFCRNRARAEAAKKDLEQKTGKKIFEIIIGDVTDANSVRKAVEEIKEPVDAIVLNAGGVIGKTAAKSNPSGMNG